MALCSRCGKRIAKRRCPALGAGLCSLCCGLLRDREIHCPPSCPYLARHKPYQEKRILEKRSPSPSRDPFAADDLLGDDRLAWLIFQIEQRIGNYAAGSPAPADKDILLALEYARAAVEKGRRLIVMPGDRLKPGNELGEAIVEAAEEARWAAPVILASGLETYKTEEKLRCLDRIIGTIRWLMRDAPSGRAYLANLGERFERIREADQSGKLIRA